MAARQTVMATRQTSLCIALAALGWAAGARADDPAARRAIEAAHVQQVRADTGGDEARWRQMYQAVVTPGFTYTLADGQTLSREQYQQRQLKFMPLMKQSQEAFHVQRVTRAGRRATEEGFLTYRVSVVDAAGRMGPKGETHTVTGRNTYRAGWVKAGASWRLADFHLLKHEERTDGRPSGA